MAENEKTERNTSFLLLYLYFGIICSFVGFLAIGIHYGWTEVREDSNLTNEEVIYLVALMTSVVLTRLLSREVRRIDKLHPTIRLIIRIYLDIVLIIYIIAVLDVCKDDDLDIERFIVCGILILALIGTWVFWMLHKNKDGETHADSFDKRMKRKDRELRIERYREHEVLESRTDMGLENPGFATQTWDGRRSYIHVKTSVYLFCAIMGIITALMIAGKHIDDIDVQTFCYLFAFIMGAIVLRTYILNPLDYAVKHKAVDYSAGAHYTLLIELSYAAVVSVMQAVVFEAQIEIWDLTGYVVFFTTLFTIFILTHLIVTVGNKRNGHEFAFFDMDGYEKRKLDPRTEDEGEE